MIITRLFGGLGNQMFQYALGRRLALDRRQSLKLDLTWFATNPPRAYGLDNFRIAAAPASRRELARIDPTQARSSRRLPWLPWRKPPAMIHQRRFGYEPAVLDCPASACLSGYWQTERYFAARSDVIRADFQLAQPMQPRRRALAEQIAATGNAVSVHVRRGDYVSNPAASAVHGTCAPEWYGRAMDLMAEGQERPTYFVFSDDPAWARANLPKRGEMVFVDPHVDRRDCEDMHLMAACRHHITANSTFSWWGAWLNPSPAKRVIVPARWFDQGPSDVEDLIPATWMRL